MKRIVASATLGITKELVSVAEENPPYIRILALRRSRKDILGEIAKKTKPLLKASDCTDENIKPLIDMDEKAHRFLSLVNGAPEKVLNEPSFLSNQSN